MAAKSLGWAIVGTGNVAHRFAADMRFSRHGRIVAVSSATPERARQFAAAIGSGVTGGDLDALLRNPAVDAVYIAGRNENRCEHALRCMAAGKPVLVEKPFATSQGDASRLRQAAVSAGILAMEAMWMRFTPGIRRLKALVDQGAIGHVRSVQAGLSFRNPSPSASPLLDLGVYPASLAMFLLGKPQHIAVSAAANESQVALSLGYPGAVASSTFGFAAEGHNRLFVAGENGILSTDAPFFNPSLLTLRRTGPIPALPTADGACALPRSSRVTALKALLRPLKDRRYPTLCKGTGLHYQTDHFAECLAKGLRDSPVMPIAESVEVIRIVCEAEAMLAAQARPADTFAGSKVEAGR